MRFPPMLRTVLFATALAFAPALAVADETAANNIFVVDSSDGYGIDTCVATGSACGQAIADAWCRVHDFERAVSFGKMRSDVPATTARGQRASCVGGSCADSVAITCSR